MSDMGLGQQGVLQVIPPAQLEQQLQQQAQQKAMAQDAQQQNPTPTELAGYIRGRWEIFRNHRNTANGWSERLLQALRTFNGQYDANKLNEIRRFSGSEVYFRVVAQKCRAATSLLRDIYLGPDRPWKVRPPADPTVDDSIVQAITQILAQERTMVSQTQGKPPSNAQEQSRREGLMDSARMAAKKDATDQAHDSEDKIEDILREGNFYHALAEFLVDVSIFPFACIKGPEVKIMPEVIWPKGGGQPQIQQIPKLTWCRVSPFDLWFTPGVADIANAEVIERMQLTRAEINDLLDLPGYNVDEVRQVLEQYGAGGYYDNWDTTDAERAVLENRENPAWNRSFLITMLKYSGSVQGKLLEQYGIPTEDPIRDYYIEAYVIGSHVIKVHLAPSPRQRHNYFITSFEKVPGTPVGNGLTDLLLDLQEMANATARSLVNNISIASGPQVVVRDDRLSPDETGEDLYPWKRWHVRSDPLSPQANEAPIDFFMPTMNAEPMIAAFDKFVAIADDISAIPKYVGGQAGSGGAGRTASGLAMLMGNASKILQTVAANIDRDVMEPALLQLTDLVMLTDTTGLLTGEEKISVEGVDVAIQRETIRQRQVEFLQATNNPVDSHIVGIKGRAAVLRAVAATIGLDGEHLVPSAQELDQMERQAKQQNAQGTLPTKIINDAVTKGAQAAITRVTTELMAAGLGQQEGMPMGMPTHIGTPGSVGVPGTHVGQPGAAPPGPGPQGALPGPPAQMPPGGLQRAAGQAQGNQPSPIAAQGGPQVANALSNQPGPQAKPVSPGPG
jgi:hypothetical protein